MTAQPESVPPQKRVLAENAARTILERAGIRVPDSTYDNALSTLGWELGDGAYTYESGMAALVNQALESSRNHTVHANDINVETDIDDTGPWIHLVVANEDEDDDSLPRMFATLSEAEARGLGEQLIRQANEVEHLWSEKYGGEP